MENHSKKVLIIEDDLANRAILEDMLRANGYETRSAADGGEGLKLAKEWNPTVVLLDLVMPGMDGNRVLESIRAMDLKPRPSVIMVSMKGDKKVIADVLEKGADDFMVKPVDEAELIARITAKTRISDILRELDEDKRNLKSMMAITSAISASLDTEEILRRIVTSVAESTGASRCSLVLVVKEDEGYVLASSDAPGVHELKLNLSRYPEIQEVIATKKPLIIEDMVNHPLMAAVRDRILDLKDMSVLIVPIVFNDEVIGTLFLRTRRKGTSFTQKEIVFCQIVANSSFHAIKNARLFEKVTKEKESLKEIAITDQLTTLYNHNFFYMRLEEEFERAIRYATPLSLIMMDIDDFKRINDSYGHRTGDVVLKEMAKIIKKGVRKTDIVARYGGEEFAVILPHTRLPGAKDEAERMRELVEDHAYAGLLTEKLTVSLGAATFPYKGVMNSGDLVNMADNALYKAKHKGKNRVMTPED